MPWPENLIKKIAINNNDIDEILEKKKQENTSNNITKKANLKISISSISELETCYYMRLNVEDRGGVLAQIAMIMGNLNISIDSVLQKDSNRQAQPAELVITTHPAKESSVQKAVTQIRALECIKSFDNLIRIEGN